MAALARGVNVSMEPDLSEVARSRRSGILLVSGAIGYMATLTSGLRQWMDGREIASLDDMRGTMSWQRSRDRNVYTRANYLHILEQHSVLPI